METILHFNKNAVSWINNAKTNKYYLDLQVNYLKETFAYRGYLYLNQICETLGIAWDPDEINPCYRSGIELNIDVQPAEGSDFVIKIYQ